MQKEIVCYDCGNKFTTDDNKICLCPKCRKHYHKKGLFGFGGSQGLPSHIRISLGFLGAVFVIFVATAIGVIIYGLITHPIIW